MKVFRAWTERESFHWEEEEERMKDELSEEESGTSARRKFLTVASFVSGLMYVVADIKAKAGGEKEHTSFPLWLLKIVRLTCESCVSLRESSRVCA